MPTLAGRKDFDRVQPVLGHSSSVATNTVLSTLALGRGSVESRFWNQILPCGIAMETTSIAFHAGGV